jgi:outer membrane protein TolC
VWQTTAQTQETQTDELTLSLEQACNFAREHNRTMQNAALDIKIAEATRWQTIASMLPQVNASLDYSNMMGYKMNLGVMSIAMPPSGTITVTASAAVNGQQIVGVLLNDIAKEMSQINAKKSEHDIVSQTTSLYVSILAMKQNVALLDSSLQNLTALETATQNAANAGAAVQTAADQITVQVALMKNNINATKRSLEMLYNSLKLQLGTTADKTLVLTQTIDDFLNEEAILSLLMSNLDMNNNFDYQLVKKNTELAQKQVTMAAMNYTPTLSVMYQYAAKEIYSDEVSMNTTPPNMFGLSLKVPLFSSGKNFMTVKEKKLARNAAENTKADTEDRLRVQDRQLRYDLTSSYENYQVQKKNIEVTTRVFNNLSDKFQHGMASNVEVTNASTDLISAQNTYITALLNFVNAHIALKKLLNK